MRVFPVFLAVLLSCLSAKADISFPVPIDISTGPQSTTLTANDLSTVGATFSFTGGTTEGTIDSIGAGVLAAVGLDNGSTGTDTLIGYTVSGLNFDAPSFAFWDNGINIRIDFDNPVDANIGWGQAGSPGSIAFRTDGTFTLGNNWTFDSPDTITNNSATIQIAADSGNPSVPSVSGATFIELLQLPLGSGLGTDINFDGTAERGFSLDLITVAVPEPSGISFTWMSLIGFVAFALGWLRRC